jgi:Iap family predicted aminopeptidase
MKRLTLVLACAVALLLALPVAAQALTFNQAVDKLFKQGYPQRLEQTIVNFKSTPLGFRWTGSPADNAAAQFIADEMTAAGLTNVKLEAVPVDAWTFEGASVAVGDKVMDASSYPGVPPTPDAGVTGEVVRIPGSGSAADFDKAGDISGKIALVNFASAYWWFNFPCAEAGLRGATAVILIYDKDYPGYQGARNAFASNDPGYTYTSPPLVWLPASSATWLKQEMAKGPVTATVKLKTSHTFATEGGVGYNVVGELPGSAGDGTSIVFGGHHDAHFTGALDNTTSCVAQLVIAKAMQMCGYQPRSSVIFFSTTAEEWGYTNCNYDWLVGSVYSIQHTHPDWAGKVKAMLELELMGYKNGSLWFTATRELKPWLVAEMKAHPKLVGPKGGKVYTPDQGVWFSYNDQWPLTAMGIPSTCMWTPNDYFWSHYYHTNYDAVDMLDWGFFKKNIKFHLELARSIDRGLLPYDLSTQSNALLKSSKAAGFAAAGIDATAANDYLREVRRYARAARAFDARRSLIGAGDVAATNQALLAIEKLLNSNLTALNVWDGTVFPFEQGMTDLTGMQSAVAALTKTPISYKDAIRALDWVNLAWYGTNFSYPVYITNLQQRVPGYAYANMADLGRMAMTLDIIPEYNAIGAARVTHTVPSAAIASLNAKIAAEQADITGRLQTLAGVLSGVTKQIKEITPAP